MTAPLPTVDGALAGARAAGVSEKQEWAESAGTSPFPAARFSESPIPSAPQQPKAGHPQSRLVRGFTLIEVLIALAVVAIALLALSRAASVQVQTFDALRERTLAGWVAANVLADTRIAATPPATGRSDGRITLAGRDWRWRRDVQRTPDADILRIDVQVFLGDAQAPSATLRGFGGGVEP